MYNQRIQIKFAVDHLSPEERVRFRAAIDNVPRPGPNYLDHLKVYNHLTRRMIPRAALANIASPCDENLPVLRSGGMSRLEADMIRLDFNTAVAAVLRFTK